MLVGTSRKLVARIEKMSGSSSLAAESRGARVFGRFAPALYVLGILITGFEGCYGAGYTGKVSFNVVANFPAALGELYSAYNVGGSDRGTVVNTSNGRVTSGGNSTTGGSL